MSALSRTNGNSSRSSSHVSSHSSSSTSPPTTPNKNGENRLRQEARRNRKLTLSDRVKGGGSARKIEVTNSSGVNSTLALIPGDLPGPRSKPDSRNTVDLQIVLKGVIGEDKTLDSNAEWYDPVKATWPGAASYAFAFMIARIAQCAVAASGNPVASGIAFAAIGGILHAGAEPLIMSMRKTMGMRRDRDSRNYANYVTAMTSYLECSLRCDNAGQQKALDNARAALDDYKLDAAELNSTLSRWTTMLKAAGRGLVSNELPFFSFTVVYALTNPLGLWARSEFLKASGDKAIGIAAEVVTAVAGGLLAGAATVGTQNQARKWVQSASHAPDRKKIKLNRLNREQREKAEVHLKTLKDQLETSQKFIESDPPEPQHLKADEIEKKLISLLKSANSSGTEASSSADDVSDSIENLLDQLSQEQKHDLLVDIRKTLSSVDGKPYSFAEAVGREYREFFATANTAGVYKPDPGKIRRVVARMATNVAGLAFYAQHMLFIIALLEQYEPLNPPAASNATAPGSNQTETHAYPTTDAQAYGGVAGLAGSLIGSWVVSRAVLAPVIDLLLVPASSVVVGTVNKASSLYQWVTRPASPAPSESGDSGVDIV